MGRGSGRDALAFGSVALPTPDQDVRVIPLVGGLFVDQRVALKRSFAGVRNSLEPPSRDPWIYHIALNEKDHGRRAVAFL